MDYGDQNSEHSIKLFGIEDLWGNISNLLDGLYCDDEEHILVGTQYFNNTGDGLTEDQYQDHIVRAKSIR